MVLTTVGYAGGQTHKPSYYKIGDHTECVDIHYDPTITTFEKILKLFLKSHDPTQHTSSQYRSLILSHNSEQEAQVAETLKEQKKEVITKVDNFKTFYEAEKRHQKNQLRRQPALLACLDWEESLASSYVATRLNGYLGGHGKMASFNREWESLGLSKKIAAEVRRVIIRRG